MLCTAVQINYSSEEKKKSEKVSVYQFLLDKEHRKKWIRAIPRENLIVNNNTGVCRYHWYPNCKSFISYCGKERPTEPHFIFDSIPATCFSSPSPKPRKTLSASCSSRNVIPGELELFREAGNHV